MTGFRSRQSGSLQGAQKGRYEELERLSFRLTEEQAAQGGGDRFLRLAALFRAWDSLCEQMIPGTPLHRLIA